MTTKSQRRRERKKLWRRPKFRGPIVNRRKSYYIWSDSLRMYVNSGVISSVSLGNEQEMDSHQIELFFQARHTYAGRKHWYRMLWDRASDWRVVRKPQDEKI